MKRSKRSAKVLLLVIAFFASLVVPTGMASATSAYDNVVVLGQPTVTCGSFEVDLSASYLSIIRGSHNGLFNTYLDNALSAEMGWVLTQGYNPGSTNNLALFVSTTPVISTVSFYSGYYPGGYLAGQSLVRATISCDRSTGVSVFSVDFNTTQATREIAMNVNGGGYRPLFINMPVNYPTGYEGALVPTEPPPAKYVGMGDSYSSGQGSRRPYMAGTETATNKCRRSLMAYPMLLGADASLNLGPTSFVACGGAKASAITTNGFNGEPAQMDALTSETNLVTITITGNDIPFDEFARACATPGIDQGCVLIGQAYLDAMTSIDTNVKSRIDLVLQALDDRLTFLGSDARVLVIGYPQLLPETWVYETGCWWLQPDELPAIRSVEDALNAAIHDKVVARGGRFEFVSATASGSPFIGHELCREVSTSSDYFNGVVVGENEPATFHPNEAGQREGYARLIKNYLILHPLS